MGNGLCRDGALAIDQVPGGLYNKLGSDTLLKLSTEFYTRVYDDDHLWFRSAFDHSPKENSIRNQFEFLTQRLGGPPLYSQRKGPPALMRRHATHPCTQATADRYMLHMDATLEALPEIDADSRQRLHHYFAHTCDFLVAGQAMGMGQGRGAGHSWAAAGTGTAATEVKAAQQEGGICSCNAGEAAEGQGPGQGRGQGRGRNGMGQGRGQGMGRRFGWGGAGAGAKGQQEGSTTASPEAPPVAPGKGSHTGRGRGWGRNGGGGLGQGRRACTGDGPCMGDMTLAGA